MDILFQVLLEDQKIKAKCLSFLHAPTQRVHKKSCEHIILIQRCQKMQENFGKCNKNVHEPLLPEGISILVYRNHYEFASKYPMDGWRTLGKAGQQGV